MPGGAVFDRQMHVGADVVAEAVDASLHRQNVFLLAKIAALAMNAKPYKNSLGSVMRPVTALAATVAGEPR